MRVRFEYQNPPYRNYSYRCSGAAIGDEVLTEDGDLGVVVGYGR